MGTVMQDAKGFFAHVALAVSGGEARIPLGVAGLIPYVRTRAKRQQSLNARKLAGRNTPRREEESSRWETLARLLDREGEAIQTVLDAQPSAAFRTVPLSARPAARAAKHRKSHPPRTERQARLQLRWAQLEIAKPQHAQTTVLAVTVNVVQVYEPGWIVLGRPGILGERRLEERDLRAGRPRGARPVSTPAGRI